jgi:hypothetical protein
MIGSPEYRVTAGRSLYSVAQSRALKASLGRTQLLPATETNGKKMVYILEGVVQKQRPLPHLKNGL